MTKFNEVIKRAHLESGMSQEQFAQKLGVTRPTLASWLSGRYQPRMNQLLRVARVIDVDVRELIA